MMAALNEREFNEVFDEVCGRIRWSGVEEKCRDLVEKRLMQWDGKMEDIEAEVEMIVLEETRVPLKNFLFHYSQKSHIELPLEFAKEKAPKSKHGSCLMGGRRAGRGEELWYVAKAQEHWQQRVVRSVHSMSTELAVPLLRKRSDKEQREMVAKWAELSSNDLDLSKFRPVYASKDFLEVVCNLRNPNENSPAEENTQTSPFLMRVNFKRKSLTDLQVELADLHISKQQSGLDESYSETFKERRVTLGFSVIHEGLSEKAQCYLRKGAPVSLRGTLWMLALGCEMTHEASMQWERLKKTVVLHDMLVDFLIFKDVKLTASNDDKYFVFEDFLYQVLLCFLRDKQVFSCLRHKSPPNYNSNKSTDSFKDQIKPPDQPYPPSGVIPFHGFSMYLAPLCYVYDNPISLYLVFREFYTRLFHHLHTISSHPHGIVSLCVHFETLLLSREAALFLHLRSLGLQPLKVAFKWMLRAFSGYLSCEQVLILWDRLIAYNSLIMLPLLAASIFSFRKNNLMQVSTPSSAESILADILTLEVVPLLQIFLFSHKPL